MWGNKLDRGVFAVWHNKTCGNETEPMGRDRDVSAGPGEAIQGY